MIRLTFAKNELKDAHPSYIGHHSQYSTVAMTDNESFVAAHPQRIELALTSATGWQAAELNGPVLGLPNPVGQKDRLVAEMESLGYFLESEVSAETFAMA